MTPEQIRETREGLKLTQAQFAQLLGVHALTVSKWERGVLRPNPHQMALIQSFKKARKQQPGIGEIVAGLLVGAGLAMALYALLEAAFGSKPQPPSEDDD